MTWNDITNDIMSTTSEFESIKCESLYSINNHLSTTSELKAVAWVAGLPTSEIVSTISESLRTKVSSLDKVTSERSTNEYTTSITRDEKNEENKSCVNIESLVEECFREFVEI